MDVVKVPPYTVSTSFNKARPINDVIRIKFVKDASVGQDLWLKPFSLDDASQVRRNKVALPQGRTLQIQGLPVYANENSIRRIFNSCGAISHVYITNQLAEEAWNHLQHKQPKLGFQEAYIVFTKKAGLDNAINRMKYDSHYALSDENDKLPSMLRVWQDEIADQYKVDTAKLLQDCTDYMKVYDSKIQKQKEQNKKMADVPDDEGWTTVARTQYKRPGKAMKGHELERFKKKKRTQELLHFYKQQVGSSKMDKILELKRKFEEDKKRIQEMRQQRKFRPY